MIELYLVASPESHLGICSKEGVNDRYRLVLPVDIKVVEVEWCCSLLLLLYCFYHDLRCLLIYYRLRENCFLLLLLLNLTMILPELAIANLNLEREESVVELHYLQW